MSDSSIYADANTPVVRNCWYVAGLVSEFTRELQQRFLLGSSVLMFLSTEGKPVLLQNRCAHRSFPLHHGRLDGDEVTCMYHGLRFDAKGICVHAPMIGRPAAHAKVRHYPTVVRGPLVWAWMGDETLADETLIPNIGWLSDQKWVHGGGYMHVKANYVWMHENLMDLTHFSYLHAGNVGTPEWVDSPFEVTVQGEQVRLVRKLNNSAPPQIYAVAMKLTHREKVNRSSDAWYLSPAMNTAFIEIEDIEAGQGERSKYNVNVVHLLTPETQHTLHYWAFVGRNFELGDEGISKWLLDSTIKAFTEDREALEWIDEMDAKEGRPSPVEASFSSDRGSLAVRKILRQLAERECKPEISAA